MDGLSVLGQNGAGVSWELVADMRFHIPHDEVVVILIEPLFTVFQVSELLLPSESAVVLFNLSLVEQVSLGSE
jgi:hypothetical protein